MRNDALRIAAGALSLAVSGCSSAKRSDRAGGGRAVAPAIAPAVTLASVPVRAACADADSAPPEVLFWSPARNPDSLRVVIDSLDARITTAREQELPGLLLAAGRAKTAFQPRGRSPLEPYARARSREFHYNEDADSWHYNGADFRTLIGRFPRSDLADQAAYALTLLPSGGECDADVVCPLDWEWVKVSLFLRNDPRSRLADSAVGRALSAFDLVPADADLRVETNEVDPKEIRIRVAQLDTIARLLAPAERARLLLRAGELWHRLSDDDRAKDAYRTALDGAQSPTRECLAARLADLPARTFLLDTTRVVHPRRVEMRWHSPGAGASGFAIYRSSDRNDFGALMARVAANQRTWIDTTTQPGAQYWYHVTASTPDGLARSNAAEASTPTETMRVDEVAVSTSDRHLYVFGKLSNGFPLVARIAPEGGAVNRSAGVRVDDGHSFDAFAPDTWLVDGAATGVLRFRTTPGALPSDLLSAVRQHRDVLRAYLAALAQGGRAPGEFQLHHGSPIVAVDESSAMAWFEPGADGMSAVSMDCLGRAGLCWLGYLERVVLRSDTRGTLANVQLSDVHHGCDSTCVTAVFADPADSSAWLVLGRSARLMHVDRSGVIRQTVVLSVLGRISFLGQIGLQAGAFDRDRRRFWYIRGADLMQVDLDQSSPTPRAITAGMPSYGRLAPDLSGGVWVVDVNTARRVDGSGRTVLTVPFNPR